ncbi:MAG: hypothetical protein AAB525_01210 [Patescibacteria group bacterium]
MKTIKHPQFLIPIIIIIIMLGWIGYQKINAIKIKQAEKQAAEQNVDVEDANPVDENTDESLNNDQIQKTEPDVNPSIVNPVPIKEASVQEPKDDSQIDTANWNSFTHRSYNYTIKFPKNWHWDGTDVDVLIISSEAIKSNDENLTANNLKIIKADQEIIEGILEKNPDAEIANLNDNFKAAYLKNYQFKNIIEQIIKSFEI